VRSWQEWLRGALVRAGVPGLDEEAWERLERYLHWLRARGQPMGLLGPRSVREMVEKDFLDSLMLLAYCDLRAGWRVVDVGAGAGLPGVPLKIARPETHLTVIEAAKRACAFLEAVARDLGLEMEVVWGRAEELGSRPPFYERYDVAVTRAVADLPSVLRLCLPLVRKGGWLVVYKGPRVEEELPAAGEAVRALRGRVEQLISFRLPSGYRRVLVVVSKARG